MAGIGPVSAWDAGMLAGVGTSTIPPVYGSVAAGLGRAEVPGGRSGFAIPLEAQLGWRLTSTVGLGIYGFGSLGGPNDFFGLSVAARIGRLR